MTERFNPWSVSSATRDTVTGVVTGTLPLAADSGLRIASATVEGDGQFLTVVFVPAAVVVDDAGPGLCEHCGLPLPVGGGGCSFCGPADGPPPDEPSPEERAGRLAGVIVYPRLDRRDSTRWCRIHGTSACAASCRGRQ